MEHLTHLYGCPNEDLDAIAAAVAPALSLLFEARDSSYWGDYYIDRSSRFTECRLYRNADPLFLPDSDPPEDYWFEPEHRDHPILLSVDGSTDSIGELHELLVRAFPQFALFRAKTYDGK